MRAISEFHQQLDKVLWMSFSINRYGFSDLDVTFKYDCCEKVVECIKALCAVHNTDGNIAAEILKDAQDQGRSYGYDQNEVLLDVCFFYKNEQGHPVRLEQGKAYA